MLQRTPGTLLDFVAWLETKDPTEEYIWNSIENCACGQYLKERGCFRDDWFRGEERAHLNELALLAAKPTLAFWYRVGTFGDLLNVVRKELDA